MEKKLDSKFFDKIKKIYYELIKNLNFTKLNKNDALIFEDFVRDYPNKSKHRKYKNITRSKLSKMFAILILSSVTLSSDAYNAPFFEPSRFLKNGDYTTQSGKNVLLSFYNDHVKIFDSYQYNFEERMEILYHVQESAKENDIEIKRDIIKLESEWYIHNVCYNLGIEPESTKDADLDYVKDARWYVNFATDVASLFYTFHDDLDNYQYNEQNIISQEDLLSYEI